MYFLRQDPRLLENRQRFAATLSCATDLLERAADGLTFDPGPHRYFLDGKELRSVSSIVDSFDPFDAEAVARKCSENPKHELFGRPVGEILSIWDARAREAADAGTLTHSFAEACYHWMTGHPEDIEPEYRCRITADGLAAVFPKEEACALWWANADWGAYVPAAKETRIVNRELGYAGTFDLLLYGTRDGRFHQKDWKTNKDLYKWYGDMLLPPLSVLKANPVGEYTVQQTLYTIQLRKDGLDVATNELIWLKDDPETPFEAVPLDMRYDRLIEYAVRRTLTDKETTTKQSCV